MRVSVSEKRLYTFWYIQRVLYIDSTPLRQFCKLLRMQFQPVSLPYIHNSGGIPITRMDCSTNIPDGCHLLPICSSALNHQVHTFHWVQKNTR